ncbi:hypothetical protein L915_17157 [Plasmopara halstedii]|uniref:HTH psq-type domain-containing protein n=1 Tax=Plasmopara halstedii TaxID=4781 RepID=A0A0P1A930_PLAHL|nr:hypothetical protein L915_17157 [Plasmopara halstedii]CEG37006.1 hypothetical protein L915_17157 [Plasmopara halstedii]|eukprot:XP_024573375.1 hypothetical protein L915_17157 [Plasmopara halstedii]
MNNPTVHDFPRTLLHLGRETIHPPQKNLSQIRYGKNAGNRPRKREDAQQISPRTEQAVMSNIQRSSPVSDRVWAQAVHAVINRRMSLCQASQAYGLQQAALHRLVRQHTLQHLRHSPRQSATSPNNIDERRFALPVANSSGVSSNDSYVFPRLNPQALDQRSPNGRQLPSVVPMTSVMTPPPPFCELTPELNNEIMFVLRERFSQQYDNYAINDERFNRFEGYTDSDIINIVRGIVSQNGRSLPSKFPSTCWLSMFKRENDLVNVDEMDDANSRSRTDSGHSLKSLLTSQQLPQDRYNRSCEQEQQSFGFQRGGDTQRWIQSPSYRQLSSLSPTSPLGQKPVHLRNLYAWEDVNGVGSSIHQQHVCSPQQSHQSTEEIEYHRKLSSEYSNDRTGNSSIDRNYRQSNLVPAKVWEAAMEDVAIHGMSLRNAAKAHGVHFAALHRRLKKRQQHKLNAPCEPNYIPFEDEAGVIRVIHARADMGVLLTFTELVDLLKRTALKHRSSLPENVATALVRKFQSRVEQSVRHLIIDWPNSPNNVLYRLRDTSSSEADNDDMNGGLHVVRASTPSSISGTSGESGSSSSSGSSPLSSSNTQLSTSLPVMQKCWDSAAPPRVNLTTSNNPSSANSVETDNSSNDSSGNTSSDNVSPDENEASRNKPCMILRL